MLRPIVSTGLDGELGVEQTSLPAYLAYPNPARDVVHIVSPYGDEHGFELFDLQGRLIAKTENNRFDVSLLTRGYYIIRSIQHPAQQIKILTCE